jgi:hypothetical protein
MDIQVVVGMPLVSVMEEEDGGLCEIMDVETKTDPCHKNSQFQVKVRNFVYLSLIHKS